MSRPTTIVTERLTLRPFADGDLETYASFYEKPQVVRFLPGGESLPPRAREIAQKNIEHIRGLWAGHPGYGPWAVEEKASGRLVGHLGLRHLPDVGGQTEVLYLFDDRAWGKGYATEGGAAALDYGFGVLGLPRIVAFAFPENGASLRVMEKIGMTRVPGTIEVFGIEAVQYAVDRPA